MNIHPKMTSLVASGSGSLTPTATPASVQEFKIRVPKNVKKKYHVMRFNATLNVDFAKWSQVKMERENNQKEFKGFDEDQPKFGAGSEFGRDAREEARRKKFGIIARKYKSEDQPWILKSGGRMGKKFKGIREGGVSENAAYYVFTHAPDGAIDAYPLQEWYNFQPIQRYKALSAEEAEHEFGRRNKVMNYFSLMLRKRLKPDEEGDLEDPDELKLKKTGGKKTQELKISEMDEWMDSDDESSESDEEKEKKGEEEELEKKKIKAKGKKAEAAKKKKKKKGSDDEAFEDSDDGDEEGRELDYISESSDSDSDNEGKANKELKGVAEEDALRNLLNSDSDSEDEENKSDKGSTKEEEKNRENESKEKDAKDKKDSQDKKKKGKMLKKKDERKNKDSSSDFSSNSSDSDSSTKKKPSKKVEKETTNSGTSSRSDSPNVGAMLNGSDLKRKAPPAVGGLAEIGDNAVTSPTKKQRLETSVQAYNMLNNEFGITEEAVRRYLMRKPMTTTELLTKFKSKKTGVSSEKLVETMTQILKKINPVKQTIKGKMYLSIKA